MTAVIFAVVVVGVFVANSAPFDGRFLPGLLIVVAPFLLLAFLLPRVIPVRCPRCNGRMRFHWLGSERAAHIRQDQASQRRNLFAYTCDACGERHVWEGSDSGHGLD